MTRALACAAATANAIASANADAHANAHADAVATATLTRSHHMLIQVTLHFAKGYIAHPYWPEREKLINIQKASGTNRARSEDKRKKSLDAYLSTHSLTMDDYRLLEQRAARPFYTFDGSDEIVVSAHQLHGMIGQGADMAPSAVRLARPEQIRTLIQCSDFRTGKTKPDGVWERFVPVKSGTGQTLSNQRGLRSDPYISNVTASGSIRLASEDTEPRARQFIAWAGQEIGVGAARKLGWGRFVITGWEIRAA
ncbi:MAG: hypothetical protein ACRDHF_14115 [Tepidiformaceae bacterium]